MKYRDIFRVAIILFGMSAIVYSLFSAIPSILYFMRHDSNLEMFAYAILTILITIGLYYLLIRQTDTIIDFFHLTRGFTDEPIDFKDLSTKSILEIGLIIVGCSLLIHSIPSFLTEIFNWFSNQVRSENGLSSLFPANRETFVVQNFLKVLTGYLFITNADKICGFLAPKENDK